MGCQAAYTPMYHAGHFASQKKYRERNFSTCSEDRPLIVQFCGNHADTLLAASRHVENVCDGIDINLGCPQDIARRGHYGAFLQDEWNLINEMVSKLRNNLNEQLGVSCKIRRFDELNKTVEYAKMLERAGCTFIGVHGRTREQRGCKAGIADWNCIKAVKDSVGIPVIANGNVQSLRDVEECLAFTGADAVMSAEGNLYNPGIFLNIHPPAWTMAKEYLGYVEKYPIPPGMAKSHLFKLFHRCIAMDENKELRSQLGQSSSLEHLYDVIDCFRKKYEIQDEDGTCDQTLPILLQPVPPYLCQPRFRYAAETIPENNGNSKKTLPSDDDESQKRIKLDHQ